jgi:hypothetical protein
LQLLLARASRQVIPARSADQLIADQFSIVADVPELPAGALGLLGEGGEPAEAFWFKADPVHLRPDRDRLMLFPAAASASSPSEAETFVRECNRLLAQDGMELRIGERGGWYLRLPAPAVLETTPTDEVVGRYIDAYLPRGPEARRWMSLLTELQMVLHASSANLEREARGLPAVNGLWIWGGGRRPAQVHGDWTLTRGDRSLLRGLAREAGVAHESLPPAREWKPGGRELMLLPAQQEALADGDLQAWYEAALSLERDWLVPLLEKLRSGEIGRIVVETGRLRLTLTGRELRRFWRRPRPLLKDLEFQSE